MALIGSLDRRPIPEPPQNEVDGPPSRKRLAATLAFQVVIAGAGVWLAAIDQQRLSTDEGFHALVAIVWIAMAGSTLRRLRATP